MIPLCKPLLPTAEKLLPYLLEIDRNRHYTNFGPLERTLRERLQIRYGAGVELLPSGTAALTAALIAVNPQRKRVLVPAWTFVASAAAIVAAGLEPYFIDVDPDTWMPSRAVLRTRWDVRHDQVGAVMIVSPFGSPVDMEAWDSFSDTWGIPVIIDAAAGFDSATAGKSPVIVSLHATKVLGAGEGGFVICPEHIRRRIEQIQQFGGTGETPGFNGKMSEYHAAVALAAIDGWAPRRNHLAMLTDWYAAGLSTVPYVHPVPGFGSGWVSSYCTVQIDGGVGPTQARLKARGIESRRWWGDGAHTHPAFTQFPDDELPVTRELAWNCLSLPFSPDMAFEEVGRVIEAL